LDARYNYPAHLQPLPSELPFFCHYHTPEVIRREPILNAVVQDLAQKHPLLKTLLSRQTEWAQLLMPYQTQIISKKNITQKIYHTISNIFSTSQRTQTLTRPEALITGIPRSGTSYLCRLLHNLQDCVVINEPTEIFHPLQHDVIPWQIATYHQDIRRRILEGIPIQNKIHNGELIEDTAVIDVRNTYQPHVTRPDFLLCTKNTLAYLSRITQLYRVMPHAPIIACVRNPIDTIASWKKSFAHLTHAKVTEFPVGHLNDPFLTGWQRQYLQEIADCTDEALKRALLWRYLAECILMYRNQLIVLNYETLVIQPTEIVKLILQRSAARLPLRFTQPITPSVARQKREILDSHDKQAIGDICRQYALEFGYDI
jgi:hypothetical protein